MMLYRNNDGKVVGSLVAGIFQKKVISTRHRLHFMNAYAIDTEIVLQLKDENCRAIEVLEKDTGNIYRIDFDHFLAKAKQVSFGYGEQLAVNLKEWQSYPKEQPKLL